MQLKDKRKINQKQLYLADKKDKLFEMYPISFRSQRKNSLRKPAENEDKINYKNLSYKVMLPDNKFHEFSFLEKYGTLYSLLEHLLTDCRL